MRALYIEKYQDMQKYGWTTTSVSLSAMHTRYTSQLSVIYVHVLLCRNSLPCGRWIRVPLVMFCV